jgi:hypothetical protein
MSKATSEDRIGTGDYILRIGVLLEREREREREREGEMGKSHFVKNAEPCILVTYTTTSWEEFQAI